MPRLGCHISRHMSCIPHRAQPAECLPGCLPAAGVESVREGLGLPACVRSVEDHGYILALGIKVGSHMQAGSWVSLWCGKHVEH